MRLVEGLKTLSQGFVLHGKDQPPLILSPYNTAQRLSWLAPNSLGSGTKNLDLHYFNN